MSCDRYRTERGRPAAALWLALAAALALPRGASAAGSRETTCSSLEEEGRAAGGAARAARVLLLWDAQPARAAAALLRAALLAAGHEARHVALHRHGAAADLCALLAAGDRTMRYDGGDEAPSVVVAPAVAAGGAPCAWSGRALDVLAAGAAPAEPRLHARFAARADRAACRAPLRRLRDRALLRDCGFLPARADGDADVFVPAGEWGREANETAGRIAGAPLRLRPVSRAALAERVAAEPERSFLFLDAELWGDSAAVPLPTAAAPRASLLVADRLALLKHAPALYVLLHDGSFAPDAAALRAALAAPAALEDAACALAPLAAGYPRWLRTARRSGRRLALAVVCSAERSSADYEVAVADVALHHIADATRLAALGAMFAPEVRFLDCADPNALADEIVEWSAQGLTWRIVGVAAPAELAAAAGAEAAARRLPLVAYTPAAARVPGATGRPERLARALHRLLAACGWRRLGLVSERAPLADAVSAALRREGALLTREVSAEAPEEAVRELRDLDTRVFFVNAGASTAARVLAAAAAAASAGEAHVWIVREYAAADGATAALRPLSLSFQWRGPAAPDSPETRGRHLRRLEREWRARAWPPHAAAVLDALITLAEGFERLVTEHNETLDYPDGKHKLSYFWSGVRRRNISGVVEDLQYDEEGAVAPSVYLERWGSAPRPRRLRTWRAGELASPGERCPAYGAPPGDGRARCWLPRGDPYGPACRDAGLAGGAAALAAASAALAAAARRWLARRDRRLERATTARILARREAAFGELAPHLVARGALVLGDELGAGRFGRVRRGELRAAGRRVAVAVKALREGASPAEEHRFLHEARLLAALRHERVVRFEGVCWEGGPPLLLMELALFGDLLRYLRARRHLAGEGESGEEAAAVGAPALTRLAREAAEALAHLAARGLVHRDVRAANCLVDARRSLKLADFGLARETGAADGEYACRGRALFPVLWMAPESLARGVASAASDAWAFGVLALELVTLGARPFGGAAPAAAARAVLAGGRPPLPRDASAETRALAQACWRRDPAARPTAARLVAWLARRPAALRPALAPGLEEPDCDSGIGEPASEHAPLTSARAPPPERDYD